MLGTYNEIFKEVSEGLAFTVKGGIVGDSEGDLQWVERFLRRGESIVYSVKSDITEEGKFGERWLVITNQRVFTYNPATGHFVEYSLREVGGVNVYDYLGSGEIEIITSHGVKELIRFSRALTAEFRKAAAIIDEICNGSISINVKISNGEERKSLKKSQVLTQLLSFLRPHWVEGLVALILSLIVVGLSLVPPYLMKVLIDEAILKSNLELLSILAAELVAVHLASTVLSACRDYLLSKLGQEIVFDIRKKLYEHVQRMSLGFLDKYGSGRIISRISDDTARIQWFLVWGVQTLIISVLKLIGIGIIVFTMNFKLALFTLLPAPFIVLGIKYFRKTAPKVYHKAWRRWADVSSILVDTIPGAMVVKTFSQERRESEKFVLKLSEVVKANLSATKLALKVFPVIGLATTISAVLVWYYGGLEVVGGETSLGLLTAFVSYMWQFYAPIHTLCYLIEPLHRALTSGERVFELLSAEPDVKEDEKAVEFTFKGHIKFEHVYFGYEPYVYVLQDVNIEIKPGEVVGIVGPSGSGKTTLTKLLLRFYDPDKGRILIDGVDIRKIKLECLRRQIAVVLQEPILFSGTIADNIAYGKPDAEPEEIIAAAKAACAHNFIMKFPLAYDTEVGERGSRLSGGERQRIAIARAIITDPKILILDEATSSVDTITEREIQKALNNLVQGRTTIVIAHRLSTIKNADKIIVLDKGRVVEVGSHEELLKRNGLYAKLYLAQFEEEKELSVGKVLVR